MTIKAICRDLRVSRKVVRKVIRPQATEFHYQRDVQPQPKIGPWRERLDLSLLENDGKPARERLTLIRVFEELRTTHPWRTHVQNITIHSIEFYLRQNAIAPGQEQRERSCVANESVAQSN